MRQADDLFVCFGAKQNKGLSSRSSTRPEGGKGTPVRELEKGTQRRQLAKGDSEGQSTTVSRRKHVREGQSGWVGIPSSFVEISLEIHASVSLLMHRRCSVTEPPFLHFELIEALIVRLFFVLFLPLPWLYFLWP